MKKICGAGFCAFLILTNSAWVSAQESAKDEHHKLEEVFVSAIPLKRTIEELALPTSVIEGDDLTRQQSTSIGESLSDQLGVSATYFGPVASRPVIRGQLGERVIVLSNGLDSLDASALSEDHAVSTDSLVADRVEIVKGPATLLYGSGAAGGVVNVVDSRIHEKQTDEMLTGAVSLGTDSAVGKQSVAVKVSASVENFVLHVDAFKRSTDDVEIPGFAESTVLRALEAESADAGETEEEAFGRLENTDSETDGGALAISYIGDKGYAGLSISQYNTNYGLPGEAHHDEDEDEGLSDDDEDEETIRIDLEQTRLDFRVEYDVDGWFENINLKAAHNEYTHTELEGGAIGTLYENDAVDVRIGAVHRQFGDLSGSLGMQFKKVDFNAVGDEAFVPPSKTESLSAFLFEEFVLRDDFVLQGSARLEHNKITVPVAESYDDHSLGGSIGAIWSIDQSLQFSANLSIAERHPNSTELFANGPHLAVQRFERGSVAQGNGQLNKELSTNIDIGFRGRAKRFEWSMTWFLNNVDDYITLTPTNEVEDDLRVFNYRQEDVRLYGMEAELLIDIIDTPTSHFHVRLFSDFVHAEQKDNGQYLSRITPMRSGIGLHFTRLGIDSSLTAKYHDAQRKTAAFELPTRSYTMLDAQMSYRFTQRDMMVFVKGKNLFDEDARRHASALKDIAPLPARSLLLGFRWDF